MTERMTPSLVKSAIELSTFELDELMKVTTLPLEVLNSAARMTRPFGGRGGIRLMRLLSALHSERQKLSEIRPVDLLESLVRQNVTHLIEDGGAAVGAYLQYRTALLSLLRDLSVTRPISISQLREEINKSKPATAKLKPHKVWKYVTDYGLDVAFGIAVT